MLLLTCRAKVLGEKCLTTRQNCCLNSGNRFSLLVVQLLLTQYTQAHTHTHTHPFYSPLDLSGITRVSWYQKGKTNLDFTEARNSEWQWHQLAICKSAPLPRQITMRGTHHSVFCRRDALPAAHPIASKH